MSYFKLDTKDKLRWSADYLVDKHIFLSGITGSGKTVTGKLILCGLADHCTMTIVDPKPEYGDIANRYNMRTVIASADVSAAMQAAAHSYNQSVSTVITIPRELDDYDAQQYLKFYFETLYTLAIARKPYRIVLEEAVDIAPQVGKSPAQDILWKIARRGRSDQLTLLIIAQSPADIEKRLVKQAQIHICHRISYRNDLEVYVDMIRDQLKMTTSECKEEILNLKPGESFVRTDSSIHKAQMRFEDDETSDEVQLLKPPAPPPTKPRPVSQYAGQEIKALTLHEPWASFIAAGYKKWETRGWPVKYRGPMAIHAGKTFDRKAFKGLCQRFPELGSVADELGNLPTGHVLAIVELMGVSPTMTVAPNVSAMERAVGNYAPGRFAWRLVVREVFVPPIPAVGKQRLWNWTVPGDATVRVVEADRGDPQPALPELATEETAPTVTTEAPMTIAAPPKAAPDDNTDRIVTHAVNIKTGAEYDTYIGRAMPSLGLPQSIWHNPYKAGQDDDPLLQYAKRLLNSRHLLANLGQLKGKRLGCFCKPAACHGDLLAWLAENYVPGMEKTLTPEGLLEAAGVRTFRKDGLGLFAKALADTPPLEDEQPAVRNSPPTRRERAKDPERFKDTKIVTGEALIQDARRVEARRRWRHEGREKKTTEELAVGVRV